MSYSIICDRYQALFKVAKFNNLEAPKNKSSKVPIFKNRKAPKLQSFHFQKSNSNSFKIWKFEFTKVEHPHLPNKMSSDILKFEKLLFCENDLGLS